MQAVSDRFVVLRGGLTLPADAVLLALSLESRGFTLTADGPDLVVCPGSQLTPADRENIRRWKMHLLAIIAYEAPEVA